MDIIEAINSRYSVRAFKQEPVPRHILGELLTVVQRTPSRPTTQTRDLAEAAGYEI